jgi:elongation factor 3
MVVIDPPKQYLDLLREALNIKSSDTTSNAEEQDENIEVLSYVASLAATLSKTQDFGSETWIDALSPYMGVLDGCCETNEAIENYRNLSEKATLAIDGEDSEDDDETGGEEICNIRFSLAYGGKILLHQTKLKLRRGNRYALVGQNGAGKTTLMTAINVSNVHLIIYLIIY